MMDQNCGCVDDILYQEGKLCTLDEIEKRECVDHLKSQFNPIRDCDCPNECDSDSYSVMMTKLDWPTERSFPRFLATVHSSLSSQNSQQFLLDAIDKYQAEKASLETQAITAIRGTFGRLNVYFSDLSMTVVEERPVYNIVAIVSNFGGLLGLYLGFSLLTILEVVDFAFDLVEYCNLQGKSIRFYQRTIQEKRFFRRSKISPFKEDSDLSR